jgi:hypothetical protein
MIEYEDLCAALERYVARTGGAAPLAEMPRQANAPRQPMQMTTSPQRTAAPSVYEPPTSEVELPPLQHHDEEHDPDLAGDLGGHALAGQHEDDATHIGNAPGAPPPLAPAADDPSNEIDIGDVLSDDEL